MSGLLQSGQGAAIVFWMALAAVVIAALVASAVKRRAGVAAVKLAIERGQSLDAATVRALLNNRPSRDWSQQVLIYGAVWTAFGIGFPLFGWLAFEHTNRVIVGLGPMMLILGVALLLVSRALDRKSRATRPDA